MGSEQCGMESLGLMIAKWPITTPKYLLGFFGFFFGIGATIGNLKRLRGLTWVGFGTHLSSSPGTFLYILQCSN